MPVPPGVLRCFLAFLLSGCFLSLSWVLAGTPSIYLGFLETSLGASWASLGDWGLSWAFLCFLGPLLAYLGPPLDSLGLLLCFPFRPSWPERRQGSNKVPQDSPKTRPRGPQGSQNGLPQSELFVFFVGPFWDPLRDFLPKGFLDAWPLSNCDFA